jgi:hypothetical protein
MHLVRIYRLRRFYAECFILAGRFSARKHHCWAVYARLTGVVFAAAFVGVASGSGQGGIITVVILAFRPLLFWVGRGCPPCGCS